MSAVDVMNISFSVSMSGGFDSKFYPAYLLILAMFAVVFASVRLSCAWTTLVAAVYVTLCCTVNGGLDLQANDEKYLFHRILMMYVAAGVVSLIAKYERGKRQEAVAREQRLQRERIELSQTIHDTVGQSAYMIGMGIDNAKELAGSSNPELLRSLDATGNLSRVGHVVAEAPHRRRGDLRRAGFGHDAEFPRRYLHGHHVDSGGGLPVGQ